MSGQQGNPPQGAPGRTLVSLRSAEAAVNSDRTLAPWFLQFLQRLSSLIGPVQPDSGGQTINQQVTNLNTAQYLTVGLGGADGATQGRLDALEGLPFPLPPSPLPPAPAGTPAALGWASWARDAAVAPLAPLVPWLTDAGATPSPPTPIYAPMVNGDLPGPSAIADPSGQFIMAPIT